jgi:thiamine biosynthesis lipoprotein
LLRGLTEHGRHDALVCAGGDIAAACDRTDTPDWRVGIEDPRDRCRVLRTICMRDGAVATSGTAARGAHIVDPVTGAPAAGLLSATVVGASLTRADVDATATFVRGAAAVGWLTATGRSALLVQPGGRVVTVGLPVEEQDAQAG